MAPVTPLETPSAANPAVAVQTEHDRLVQAAETPNHPTGFFAELWLYTKYQLLTKPFLFLVVVPLLGLITEGLLLSSGRRVLSSGDFLPFLFSWQGGVLVLLGVCVMVVAITTDISAFILMEGARLSRRAYPTAFQAFRAALISARFYLHPGIWVLVAYVVLMAPLAGVGLSVGVFQDFSLPNFVTHVIYTTPLYLVLYGFVLLALLVLGFFLQFSFHFVVLEGRNPWQGIRASVAFVRTTWLAILRMLSRVLLFFGFMLLLIFCLSWGLVVLAEQIETQGLRRFFMLLTLIGGSQLLSFLVFIAGPVVVRYLTDFFFIHRDPVPLNERLIDEVLATPPLVLYGMLQRSRYPFRSLAKGLAVVLVFNSVTAVGGAWRFDKLFAPRDDIQIVAHRAGGDLGPENSLPGLMAAIQAGVAWAEIDVQRTADGGYVVNHDADFRRLSGSALRSEQMTMAEATRLPIRDAFDASRPPARVASLDAFMKAAKGRIGLFIELKGTTADRRMVDDVARMIKAYGMQREAAILSLDYELLRYAEETYPELDTGYLYFFSLGNPGRLVGDYLIMEEGEATQSNIRAIRKAGKRVIVWTVNTRASIDRFVASEVDGIITDYPLRVREAIEQRQSGSERELMLDAIFAE
ncbi:MAG: glycerophosphoryl diester phosphodiesterase membrane domain-containing protein [Lautropia sp.]|nr:glycerophosphoryl diester phosphodiesterase membrane domain-containing protein [Lautropia sp.]